MDAEHNYPLYGIDISDTNDDGEIDLIAAVDGITGNISYASRTGSSWDTQNYVFLGDYLGASITIADVNRDGKMDFFVPTEVTLTRLQDSSAQNQTYLLVDNLREVNTVEIILGNPNGNGYLSSLSFDVGRRPTMAVPGQLAAETTVLTRLQSDKEIGHTDSQTAQCGLILKDGQVLVTSYLYSV